MAHGSSADKGDHAASANRRDPEVRRRMSGPAMRTFLNIAGAWNLSVDEQRALLGWPAPSTYHKYKAGSVGTLSFDTLTRVSLASAASPSRPMSLPSGRTGCVTTASS
jgi:hypothetical protein